MMKSTTYKTFVGVALAVRQVNMYMIIKFVDPAITKKVSVKLRSAQTDK